MSEFSRVKKLIDEEVANVKSLIRDLLRKKIDYEQYREDVQKQQLGSIAPTTKLDTGAYMNEINMVLDRMFDEVLISPSDDLIRNIRSLLADMKGKFKQMDEIDNVQILEKLYKFAIIIRRSMGKFKPPADEEINDLSEGNIESMLKKIDFLTTNFDPVVDDKDDKKLKIIKKNNRLSLIIQILLNFVNENAPGRLKKEFPRYISQVPESKFAEVEKPIMEKGEHIISEVFGFKPISDWIIALPEKDQEEIREEYEKEMEEVKEAKMGKEEFRNSLLKEKNTQFRTALRNIYDINSTTSYVKFINENLDNLYKEYNEIFNSKISLMLDTYRSLYSRLDKLTPEERKKHGKKKLIEVIESVDEKAKPVEGEGLKKMKGKGLSKDKFMAKYNEKDLKKKLYSMVKEKHPNLKKVSDKKLKEAFNELYEKEKHIV